MPVRLTTEPRHFRRLVLAALPGCVLIAFSANAQPAAAPATPAAATAVSGARPASAAAAAPTSPKANAAPSKTARSGPLWSELTDAQKAALQPLAAHWNLLSDPQKRKWLALSRDFADLPAPEQAMLHSRMTDWAALSPRQRAQARLNFAEVKRLSPQDRKEKWAAYQALSEKQKNDLAAKAAQTPRGAAVATRPASAQKQIQLPPPASGRGAHSARIQLGPPLAAQRAQPPALRGEREPAELDASPRDIPTRSTPDPR